MSNHIDCRPSARPRPSQELEGKPRILHGGTSGASPDTMVPFVVIEYDGFDYILEESSSGLSCRRQDHRRFSQYAVPFAERIATEQVPHEVLVCFGKWLGRRAAIERVQKSLVADS